jgi:hypothetical protein
MGLPEDLQQFLVALLFRENAIAIPLARVLYKLPAMPGNELFPILRISVIQSPKVFILKLWHFLTTFSQSPNSTYKLPLKCHHPVPSYRLCSAWLCFLSPRQQPDLLIDVLTSFLYLTLFSSVSPIHHYIFLKKQFLAFTLLFLTLPGSPLALDPGGPVKSTATLPRQWDGRNCWFNGSVGMPWQQWVLKVS